MPLDDSLQELILEHVSDAVVATDAAGTITAWNAGAQRLYGVSEAEAVGQPLREVYRYEWVDPRDEAAAAAALRESDVWRGHNIHVRRDGTRIHVESTVIARRNAGGAVSELVAVIQDVSDRTRAERRAAESDARSRMAHETLHQSESRLHLVLESIHDYAIFTMDPERTIDRWNSGAERTFGYTAEEAIGRSGDIIFTPEDREQGAPDQEMIEARDTGRAEDERWHVRKDGSRLFVSGILSALRNPKGELAGYVKITRDLTERKDWEDRLRQAHQELEGRVAERTEHVDRLLRQLVGVQEDERRRVARDIHDHLGQQMTALRLNLALLRDATGDDPRFLEQVDRAENLAAVIDGEVDFLAWELRPGSLEDLGLAAALSDFVREFSRHYGIAAEFHAAGVEGVRLAAHAETNLYRIAQEALNNVYKHARATHVSVVLERRDSHVVLVIEDDGQGFEPAAMTLKSSTDRGLGLIGMHERAALIGGTVEIESAAGAGTTVFVQTQLEPESRP